MSLEQRNSLEQNQKKTPEKSLPSLFRGLGASLFKRLKQEAKHRPNANASAASLEEVTRITPDAKVSRSTQEAINNLGPVEVKKLSKKTNRELNLFNIFQKEGRPTGLSRLLVNVAAAFSVSNVLQGSNMDVSKLQNADLEALANSASSKLELVVEKTGDLLTEAMGGSAQASTLSDFDFHAAKDIPLSPLSINDQIAQKEAGSKQRQAILETRLEDSIERNQAMQNIDFTAATPAPTPAAEPAPVETKTPEPTPAGTFSYKTIGVDKANGTVSPDWTYEAPQPAGFVNLDAGYETDTSVKKEIAFDNATPPAPVQEESGQTPTRSLEDMIAASRERQAKMRGESTTDELSFTLNKPAKPSAVTTKETQTAEVPELQKVQKSLASFAVEGDLDTAQESDSAEVQTLQIELKTGDIVIELETQLNKENLLGEELSLEEIPSVYSVKETIDGVDILQSGTRVLAKQGDKYYALQPEAIHGVPSEIAEQVTSVEGFTQADKRAVQDMYENTAFSSLELAEVEAGIDPRAEATLAKAGDFVGLAKLSPELAREYAKYGSNGQEQAAITAATINWLRGQSKETNAALWKQVELARANPDAPRSKTIEALVNSTYVFDLDTRGGVSSAQINDIAANLPVSQTETLLQANLNDAIRSYLTLSPEQIAGVGNGTAGRRIANRLYNITSSGYNTFQSVDNLRGFYTELEDFISAARRADPEEGVQATAIGKYNAEIAEKLPDLYALNEYAQTANEFAQMTGGEEFAAVTTDAETGREAFVNVNREGETTGTIDFQEAKQKWSLNLLETAFSTITSGVPTVSTTHRENIDRKTAQAGGLQRLEAILDSHQLDGDRREESTRLLPPQVKKGMQYLGYISPFVPAVRSVIPPAFFNQAQSEFSGGNSTELQIPDLVPQTYEQAFMQFSTLAEGKDAIMELVSQGADPDEAAFQVTGLQGEALEKAKSILFLGSSLDPDAYTGLDNTQVVDLDVKENQELIAFARMYKTAAGQEVNLEKSAEKARGFVAKYEQMQSDAGEVATVRGMMRKTLDKYESDKIAQTRLMKAISEGKVGEIQGTHYELERVTADKVANVTTAGEVVLLNTVGTKHNTAVKVNTVKTSASTEVFVLRDTRTGALAGQDGAVDIFFEQCGGNPGAALHVEDTTDVEVCLELEICPINEGLVHAYTPNVTVANALSDNGEGESRFNAPVSSEKAKQELREARNEAYTQATKRNLANFKHFYAQFQRTGQLDYAAYNITPGTTFLGITAEQLIANTEASPVFANKLQSILDAPQFTEATALNQEYESETKVNLGFGMNSKSVSKNFHHRSETDRAIVDVHTKVTQTTDTVQGRLKSQGSNATDVAYLDQTTYKVLQDIRDACDEVQTLQSYQVGLASNAEEFEASGRFKQTRTRRKIEQEKQVTEKEQPPAPEPEPEPTPEPEPEPEPKPEPEPEPEPEPVREETEENSLEEPTPEEVTPANQNNVEANTERSPQTPGVANEAPASQIDPQASKEVRQEESAPASVAPPAQTNVQDSTDQTVTSGTPANIAPPASSTPEPVAPANPAVAVPVAPAPQVDTGVIKDTEQKVTVSAPSNTPGPVSTPMVNPEIPTTDIPEVSEPEAPTIDTNIGQHTEVDLQTPVPPSTPGSVEVPSAPVEDVPLYENDLTAPVSVSTPPSDINLEQPLEDQLDNFTDPEFVTEDALNEVDLTPEYDDLLDEVDLETPDLEAPIEIDDSQILEDVTEEVDFEIPDLDAPIEIDEPEFLEDALEEDSFDIWNPSAPQ